MQPLTKIQQLARSYRAQRLTTGVTVSALDWAIHNATIVHPRLGKITFSPYPYQTDFLNTMYEPRRIILKARQIGFSQVFALEALYYALTVSDSTTLLISRNQDLASNLLNYCYIAHAGLPSPPKLTKQNESELKIAHNNARIISLPANRSAGRGYAANRVYLDEFAFASYDDEIYTSVVPTLSQGGTLTIASTPNGTNNLFYKLWVETNNFLKRQYDWRQCPAYVTDSAKAQGLQPEQSAWYQKMRPDFTDQRWAQEFDCDFEASGDAVFTRADMDRTYIETLPKVQFGYNSGTRYVMTVDVGRRKDAHVINVVDTLAGEKYLRVFHERITGKNWPYLQFRTAQIQKMFNAITIVESNGVGDPFIENLDIPQSKLVPWFQTAKSKFNAIQALQLMLQQALIQCHWNDIETREFINYQWDDANIVQDTVISMAIMAAVLMARANTEEIVTYYEPVIIDQY